MRNTMAAIQIKLNKNVFEIKVFRNEEDLTDVESSDFVMRNITRNSMQQIERYFKRMLTVAYFEKLKTDENEEKRIRRLYEIGARR